MHNISFIRKKLVFLRFSCRMNSKNSCFTYLTTRKKSVFFGLYFDSFKNLASIQTHTNVRYGLWYISKKNCNSSFRRIFFRFLNARIHTKIQESLGENYTQRSIFQITSCWKSTGYKYYQSSVLEANETMDTKLR